MLSHLRKLGLPRSVYWITALAFFLRVVVRLHSGAASFWVNGYSFFFELAQSIASGKGFAFADGVPTVFRVPVYPLFLAGLTLGRQAFWPIVLAQSAIGAATVFCTAVLARQMFAESQSARIAPLAAAVVAVYPYYVVHDTALQETGLFTFLTILSVIVAHRTARTGTLSSAALTGFLLGLDVLTRVTIAPFAALVPLWLLWKRRGSAAIVCALLTFLVVFPWALRTYKLTSVPTLTTQTGAELWNGNNSLFFDHYPQESSDRSKEEALDALSLQDQAQLNRLHGNEASVDRWFLHKALAYMRLHPWLTVANGFRKIAAAFSWVLSPHRGFVENLFYALSYGPVMLLGLWGMFLRRSVWRKEFLIYALFAEFLPVTALFWGHTSHRVYLDCYWILFGAGALITTIDQYVDQHNRGFSHDAAHSA
jgi:hypothetical protein